MTELHLGPGWRKLAKDEVAPGGQEQIHHYWLDQPFHSNVKAEVWVYDEQPRTSSDWVSASYQPDNDTYWLSKPDDVKQVTREQYESWIRGDR